MEVKECMLVCVYYTHAPLLLTKAQLIPPSTILICCSARCAVQVQYKAEQIEAAWPLGAAINMLG